GERLLAVVGIIGSLITIALLADGMFGAVGIKHSLLGYDPVVGARFYGIGNEYMGVLVGSTILAVSYGLDRLTGAAGFDRSGVSVRSATISRMESADDRRSLRARRISALFALAIYASVALYIAAPQLGTN